MEAPRSRRSTQVNGAAAGDATQEAGGRVVVGVAVNRAAATDGAALLDPDEWALAPAPVLVNGSDGSWDDVSVFANAAVRAPDGRIALTYMGFGRDAAHPDGWWGGIGVAYGMSPVGPFVKDAAPMIAIDAFPRSAGSTRGASLFLLTS